MTSYTTESADSIRGVAERSDRDAAERNDLSPLAAALASVGDRWTLLIVAALLDGPRRFGDLQRELPGIAPNILTQRLRHLEREALLVATPYTERPRRLQYELTESGRELAGALRERRPSLPVLLMTGGVYDSGTGEFTAVLEKPFSSQDLLAALAAALRTT